MSSLQLKGDHSLTKNWNHLEFVSFCIRINIYRNTQSIKFHAILFSKDKVIPQEPLCT